MPQNIFYEEDGLTTWFSFFWLNCHPIQMWLPFISGKECIDLPNSSLLTVYCFSLKIHTLALWLYTSLLWVFLLRVHYSGFSQLQELTKFPGATEGKVTSWTEVQTPVGQPKGHLTPLDYTEITHFWPCDGLSYKVEDLHWDHLSYKGHRYSLGAKSVTSSCWFRASKCRT